MKTNLRYELVPQMRIYDKIGYKWIPFIMFTQTPNFRSHILNTDINSFRYNSLKQIKKKSVFENDNNLEKTILLGGSFAFGVGATQDQNTISGGSNNDYINLSGRAHVGFQEIITLFSNLIKIKRIKKIIIISGINDLYLSKFFDNSYPDIFYFNSRFKDMMGESDLSFKKKILKNFVNYFYPETINVDNINEINKTNLHKLFLSKKFKEKLKNKKTFETVNLKEKIERNFVIYRMLKNHLKCEVEFYLQPCLKWSKEPCKEERLLLEYSQKFFSKINQFSSKIFDDSVYLYILEVLKNLSDKYEIKFFDTNSYFKESLNVNDWVFVDSVHCNDLGYSMIKKYIENNEY